MEPHIPFCMQYYSPVSGNSSPGWNRSWSSCWSRTAPLPCCSSERRVLSSLRLGDISLTAWKRCHFLCEVPTLLGRSIWILNCGPLLWKVLPRANKWRLLSSRDCQMTQPTVFSAFLARYPENFSSPSQDEHLETSGISAYLVVYRRMQGKLQEGRNSELF